MNRFVLSFCSAVALMAGLSFGDTYTVDNVHSSAVFRAKHANLGHVWGRFDEVSGSMTLDQADPSKDSFSVTINVESVNTNQPKRDAHLKSPDFFNSKQYSTIVFKSASVAKGDKGQLLVTGSLQMHGVSKTITVPVEVIGFGQFPPGMSRAGVEAEFTVNTKEFEIKGVPGGVGEEIKVIIALEGTK